VPLAGDVDLDGHRRGDRRASPAPTWPTLINEAALLAARQEQDASSTGPTSRRRATA
jgi:hypothetical protein